MFAARLLRQHDISFNIIIRKITFFYEKRDYLKKRKRQKIWKK